MTDDTAMESPQALQIRAELDQSITTAKAYPRDISQARRDMIATATLDEQTAASMTYALPRDGKEVTGPSIRLAELAVSSWGNIQAAARIVSEDDKTVVAEGACHDLQTNVRVMAQASVSIVTKNGRRYSDSMIETAKAAAMAKAYRNAVFKAIPGALIQSVLDEVNAKLHDAAAVKIDETRPKLIKEFESKGVDAAALCRFLGVESTGDIDPLHIVRMRSVYNSLKDGYMTPQDIGVKAKDRNGMSMAEIQGDASAEA